MADPTFTFPPPDAALTGSIQLFEWDLGGLPIESAWLYLGSTPGGTEHLARWVGTGTASSAAGLPIDGSVVHGRIWYRLDGEWSAIERSWVAATSAGLPAVTTPLPGSTLSDSTATFRWTAAGQPVDAWWLRLGRQPGRADLAAIQAGTDLEATVAGLPRDQSTIHARLHFLIGGIWHRVDATYQAAAPPPPPPPPGGDVDRDELIRELQALVGVGADGIIGPLTRAALDQNWVARSASFDPSFAERFTNDPGVVSWVQRRLVARGRQELAVDGEFGPLTEAAAQADLDRGGIVAVESFEALLDPAP